MNIQKHNTMKTTRLYTLFALLIVFAVSCNKPDEPNNGGNNDNDVRVTTYTPQDITATTAKCGGDVIVTQGLSLTELGVCWGMEENPTADQLHLSTTVWNEPFICTITDLEPDTKYYVRAYIIRGIEYYYGDNKSFTTESGNVINEYEYVDLGLPSGTLWATCNIGATCPEGYGDYFAWGEIEPKDFYNWNTYKHCNGDYKQLTKYCYDAFYGYNGFTDDLTTLEVEDDVASVNWGNEWCMPTYEQWRELECYTISTWMASNGIYGRQYTANGQSIFIPAAGYKWDNIVYDSGTHGRYWSSSLVNPDYQPYFAVFYGFVSNNQSMSFKQRLAGYSIRPVRSSE